MTFKLLPQLFSVGGGAGLRGAGRGRVKGEELVAPRAGAALPTGTESNFRSEPLGQVPPTRGVEDPLGIPQR